jgi:hypothetical protein
MPFGPTQQNQQNQYVAIGATLAEYNSTNTSTFPFTQSSVKWEKINFISPLLKQNGEIKNESRVQRVEK